MENLKVLIIHDDLSPMDPVIITLKEIYGEDNVIYLVALPSSSTEFKKADLSTIASIANASFKNLGLETRVVVYESNDPFDPAHIDPNDSYALLGSSDEITEAVAGASFTKEIQDAAGILASKNGPEESGTTNNKFEQGINRSKIKAGLEFIVQSSDNLFYIIKIISFNKEEKEMKLKYQKIK